MSLQLFILNILLIAVATASVLVKTCPLHEPPENGALACHNIGDYRSCVVMCNDKFDFVFNPPLMYFCSEGEWNFYSLPGAPYQPQLPWPDCSNPAKPSYFKTIGFSHFFFNGDGNDPNVQAAIKANYISLMTNPSIVPPFFCLFRPAECNQDTVQLYVGASTV
ncbi:hypothetical protein ACROYT_G019931 [Oculina patagonica]